VINHTNDVSLKSLFPYTVIFLTCKSGIQHRTYKDLHKNFSVEIIIGGHIKYERINS
jgi:hypothetical protein